MGSLPRRDATATSLDVAEAAADLDAVLARVAAGEEIVLARDGVPVARLIPATAAEPQAAPPPPEEDKAGEVVAEFRSSVAGQRLGESVRALRDAGRP